MGLRIWVVQGLRFGVRNLGDLGFRIWGLGFRIGLVQLRTSPTFSALQTRKHWTVQCYKRGVKPCSLFCDVKPYNVF